MKTEVTQVEQGAAAFCRRTTRSVACLESALHEAGRGALRLYPFSVEERSTERRPLAVASIALNLFSSLSNDLPFIGLRRYGRRPSLRRDFDAKRIPRARLQFYLKVPTPRLPALTSLGVASEGDWRRD